MYRQKSYSLLPRKRKWQKVIEPLSKYERKDNGLDFALDFFYQIEKMLELGFEINLNIPYTLTGAHDNFLQTIFTSQDKTIGQVKLTPSFSKTKFQCQVENSIRESAKKIKNKQIAQVFQDDQDQNLARALVIPFAVMKQKRCQDGIKNFNKIWNCYECKKINTIDSNQIFQQYIFTKNMQASITRFFYFKDNKKNVAYKIDNYENFIGKGKDKKLWKVQQKQEYSCHFVKVMHQNKSFEVQSLNLIKYLEKYYEKKVQKMVTDWVIDTSNRYYMIDFKQVVLIQQKKKFRIKRSLSQLLSTVTCCMCLQSCNHSQISKILTNKLIINFYEHLKKRGISLSFKINFKKIQNFSKVCDLCYNLVVAEANLIETQKKMSEICNFQSQYQKNYKLSIKKQQKLNQNLHQWRLFFFLEDIRDLAAVFSEKNWLNQNNSLYLKLQVDDSITCFEIKAQQQNILPIKIIKVEHILFDTSNIQQFLQKAQIRVQICTKLKPIRVIAQGCIRGIDNQSQQQQQINLQRKYKQILLFNQNSKYCILGLYIGFCDDGLRQVNLLQMQKIQNIYKPYGNNVYCQSLPSQWMQIIDQNYQFSNSKQYKQENVLQNKSDLKANSQNKSTGGSRISVLNQQILSNNKQNCVNSHKKITLPKLAKLEKSNRQTRPRLVL